MVILIVITGFWGCKKSKEVENVISKKTLTVQLEAGVTGQPDAGNHSYDLNTSVPYSYSASTGYENLQVKINGSQVSNSGTIVMSTDHILNASAVRRLYFEGNWLISIEWQPSGQCNPDNVYNAQAVCSQNEDNVTLTIDNTLISGKVNLQGEFELSGQVVDSGIVAKYSFVGVIDTNANPLTLSGSAKMEASLESSPDQVFCTVHGTLSGRKL